MKTKKFEESKASGAHQQLNRLCGNWKGITRTWFEPGKLADESPMEGTIQPLLDGRFVMHHYKGTLQGHAMEGYAMIGCDLKSGKFQCAWIDNIHMSTEMMFSESRAQAGSIDVVGSYGLTDSDQRWGWRTEVTLISDDEIAITMYNITPVGEEAKGVETTYTRIA